MMDSVVLGFLGWIFAALMIGLWWGERGRRQAAERYVVFGSPESASAPPSSAVPPEPEDRWRDQREEAVEQGVDELRQAYRAQGRPFDEKQLRQEVETMLGGSDVPG